ncbi:type I polyketide synthase [Roseovarius salinarum]|uniref:type I polyketide synthase n=1 Tax=Roseovarius salinarum TaxID=1981892 RepID=UPI000C31FD30|nr:type I polyketide synthase [Roseovarius salinarum]
MPEDFAIVGMSLKVPGAQNADAFWRNLAAGTESIVTLDEDRLAAAGESRARMADPDYVASSAPLDRFDHFDAEFFGFGPKDAAILDPQHRKFLEVCWEAMEQSGHVPERFGGDIGVYAGCGMGSYFYFNICSNPDLVDDVGMFLLRHTGNDKDFLATRVSHVFDLRGPSVNIQTACSTSLVALHYACRALRDGDCDMALAGGVTIELPQGRGYLAKENEILSPDGHCHAFDHRAQGTVFGSGAGVVAVRRLSDAIADGDHIWAVVKGTAVNNDGAAKAGYLAPSVDGQAAAVARALDTARVGADTIGYVECHGTGTYLGDPIEVAALTEAFRRTTAETGFCRIGSVKTNIGHLDTAAGVASLIKASLALYHRQIPPSLGYEAPNPAIDFAASPFRVNDRLTDWPGGSHPRRAGVNSLGVGGTNAHAVLEEPPERGPSEESDWPFHALCLSARGKAALDANAAELAAHLRAHPEQPLADVAHTLKQGRAGFDERRVVVAESQAEAADLLEQGDPRRVFTHRRLGADPDVVFMFPGGGAQYPGMARDLYETEPVFAEWMDRGLDHLQARLAYDIRAVWLPDPGDHAAAEAQLRQPSVQLPLIMIAEYALAQLWLSWGVRPTALIGHSMGENTAAAVAGAIGFEDCIDLVLLRGRLFDTVPAGGMLGVGLPTDELAAVIGNDLDIASVNAADFCTVSGPTERLDALRGQLEARGIDCQPVNIDIAAHSRMLDPVLPEFRTFLAGLDLAAPRIPFVSNRTGDWITHGQATDPDYWVGQLRNTVQFARGMACLSNKPDRVFLEVGPGRAMTSLAQMDPAVGPERVLGSLRHPDEKIADDKFFVGVIGRLWATGVEADWSQIWGDQRRNRVVLPTYAFQSRRYFIEPGQARTAPDAEDVARNDDVGNWGYRPLWKPRYADCAADALHTLSADAPKTWLFFADETGLAEAAAERLRGAGHTVLLVRAGDSFVRHDAETYTLAPEQGREGYEALVEALVADGHMPDRIGHFWLVTEAETHRPGSDFFTRNMEQGFYSLMHLAQALEAAGRPEALHLTVFTTGAARVTDEALPDPEKATIAGPAGVIPKELPGMTVTTVDLAPAPAARRPGLLNRLTPGQRGQASPGGERLDSVLEELLATPSNAVAAHRGTRRFERDWTASPLPAPDTANVPGVRAGGTYLITGGLGGIGLTIARALACGGAGEIVLLARSPLPPRDRWAAISAEGTPQGPTQRRIAAIRGIEAEGATVRVETADVCDVEQMARIVARTRTETGGIDGVIHAAGTIDDAPLLGKEPADVERVFAPKINGVRVIDRVFADGELDFLVLFSSTSTVTQPEGQIDYVAANAFLNAYADARKGDKTHVLALNWGIWAEVGMAAEALAAPTEAADWQPLDRPLLHESRVAEDGEQAFRVSLSDSTDWVLDDHRTMDGTAVLPGTAYVELALESHLAAGGTLPLEIRDLVFLRPVVAQRDGRAAIQTRLQPAGGATAFETRSPHSVDGQTGTVLNAQGVIAPAASADTLPPVDLAAVAARCTTPSRHEGADGFKSPQEAHLRFGPRWRVVHEAWLGEGEGIARITLPPDHADDLETGFVAHPAMLDLATGWAMELIDGYAPDRLWVPVSYGTIRLDRPLPGRLFSWISRREETDGPAGVAAFDVTLCDEDGAVVGRITDFQMQRLDTPLALSDLPPVRPDDLEPDTPATSPQTDATRRMQRLVALGIRPGEGAEAFRRTLATHAAQVVVSPVAPAQLIAQAAPTSDAAATSGPSFERPDLDSAYAPPETAIETRLAQLWQELLGVGEIGVDDSFFDLGGHSLLAVRLFAAVKREYGVQFPISVLFEAPTVRACAALIEARTGGPDPVADDGPDDAATGADDIFRHAVALNGRDAGHGTPLFIVAGMFGNVLNLRHLAQRLPRRPVYGLQARGLIGDEAPHDTIPQAATDHIAEMRRIQPAGPYLLAGFSGGGITAYEIARQLEAAGETVALLALLDTPLPVRPALARADKAMIKLAEFRRKGARYLLQWAADRWAWEMHKRTGPQADNDAEGQFNNRRIETAFRRAVAAYRLAPWDGPAVLFRPPLDRHWKVTGGNWVSRQREYVFEDNQWTPWMPNLKVVEVPGDHDSMVLSPNVRVLARRLSEEIEAAEASPERRRGWPDRPAAE